MKKITITVISLMMFVGCAGTQPKHNYKPPCGYVPDETTAIAIAVAALNPIYGADKIAKEKPYKAELKGNIWIVTGSLPEGYAGGVAVAEISKSDGAIFRISHGK